MHGSHERSLREGMYRAINNAYYPIQLAPQFIWLSFSKFLGYMSTEGLIVGTGQLGKRMCTTLRYKIKTFFIIKMALPCINIFGQGVRQHSGYSFYFLLLCWYYIPRRGRRSTQIIKFRFDFSVDNLLFGICNS